MEPLFEVSFMPSWLAIDPNQTIMHYNGITSPPSNMTKWGGVVGRMASHLAARYNESQFMFEVWNEPNGGFFTPPGAKNTNDKVKRRRRISPFDFFLCSFSIGLS